MASVTFTFTTVGTEEKSKPGKRGADFPEEAGGKPQGCQIDLVRPRISLSRDGRQKRLQAFERLRLCALLLLPRLDQRQIVLDAHPRWPRRASGA